MSAGYQSEKDLENKLIDFLVKEKNYHYPKDEKGRGKIKNVDDLIENLRKNINQLNAKALGNKELTDHEFEQIWVYLDGKSVYQSAKQLRDRFLLIRDDQSEAYIKFIDFENPEENNFELAHQITVKGSYENRYDVTILCNGFPIVQIELKRRGMEIKQAFNQVSRYARHTYTGLFKYIQIFVISNGVNTKYFANSDQQYRFNLAFYWTDFYNHRKSQLDEFADHFFNKSDLIAMLDEYMIINDTDKLLMVMRPYQIWATKALVKQATETSDNAYVWHGTGSGKTLTSFKTAQILARRPEIKKVVFVIDRQDLDAQSVEEFNKFEAGSVDSTDNTRVLIKQFKDEMTRLIVTTVQKLYRAVVTDRYAPIMEKYENDKMIFIVDECHRSTFGQMSASIRRFFHKAQYFGFTGTPIFKENAGPDQRTTADIFGKCIHSYLLKDAIADKNVLGFSVEYIQTFTGQYDEEDDEEVYAIDKKEVFENDDRIKMVAKHIIDYYDVKTLNKKYNALFATPSVEVLLKYYDTFKRLDHDLKIGAIFSYQDNMDIDEGREHHKDALARIMEDYNKEYGTSFNIASYEAYKKDLTKRLKKNDINLVLVVQQLLTGFDSKITNTLFVDKYLDYHNLIQAYSRTNRIFDSQKLWGNIVCFRNLKKETDEAIALFNNTKNTDVVLQRNFNEYLKAFEQVLYELYAFTPSPKDVDQLKSEEDKLKFVKIFRRLAQLLLTLKTFVEFDEDLIPIDRQSYEDFKSKYFDIYKETEHLRKEPEKTSILDDIDFNIELVQTDRINFDYIMNLIRNINFEDNVQKEKDISKINTELDRTDNPALKKKVDLIRAFLKEEVPNMDSAENVDDRYNSFLDKKREEEIEHYAENHNLSYGLVKDVISEYEFSNRVRTEKLNEKIHKGYLKTRLIIKDLVDFAAYNVERFL